MNISRFFFILAIMQSLCCSVLVHGVRAQELDFSWKLLSETKYESKQLNADGDLFWVPILSSEMDTWIGQYVCLEGYLDSTLVNNNCVLRPHADGLKRTSKDSKPLLVALDGVILASYAANECAVCGTLSLNQDDVKRPNFILEDAKLFSIDTPEWIRWMEQSPPNARAVKAAYESYHLTHPYIKTRYTQEYKRWIVQHRSQLDAQGYVHDRMPIEHQGDARGGGDIWTYAGPKVHYDSDGSLTPGFRHSNVYCHDRSSQNSDILYCGTESGGAYKTVDGGAQWTHITGELIIGDVQSLRVHPNDDNIVIMSAANDLWRTEDGGISWQVIGQAGFVSQNIRASEMAFSPDNPDIVYAATNLGFYRSEDGGDTWTEVLTHECNTLAIKPNDPSVVYTIQRVNNSNSKFFKSEDYGITWTMYDTGWFANGLGVLPEGGRLAVTAADPERIYALLVGYQSANATVTTNGWIGAWVSYDAGATWSFPHGLIGTPYTDAHPNLMNFQGDDGEYTQINYNTTMIVSQLDPNKVLIGGLNLWMSSDACATYEGVGGYIGGIDYFHVDQQEYRIYLNGDGTEEIWFSNDGGIGKSSDFMVSHDNLNKGIQAVNLWGYDQGWNEDMMVGGRYHNGNMAYHELYPAGEFLALGGGESATGYVNYSDENRTFHSDIGGYVLPDALDGNPVGFGTSMYPNESYWTNSSSRILFDNAHFNTAWLGKDNAIYKSLDGGATFALSHSFSNDAADRVLWIEQSYADANTMYVHFVTGNQSHLYRTTDGGQSWGEMDIPFDLREMVFSVGSSDSGEVWLAYYYGTNGAKVYHTADAGITWDNITTPSLDGEEIWAIAHAFGTDGGVYIAAKNGAVYYRNNALVDWQLYASGLPASTEPLRLVPFYKGEKIRLATWNLGVWEAPLYEVSSVMADFASEQGQYQCPGSTMHFVNHSVVPAGATYSWSMPGATPSSSNLENPTVIYNESGIYDVTLNVTYEGVTYTKTRPNYISQSAPDTDNLYEDFENAGFAANWSGHHSTGGVGNWQVTGDASAYGGGNYAMKFDNWYFDAQGGRDEIWLPKMGFDDLSDVTISFDVAYARYNDNWSDTLAVLVSVDCGQSWQEIFVKGGTALSTAPDQGDAPFVPTATQWRSEEVSLLDYFTGAEQDVIVAFQNRGYYGQWLYVDNINISTPMSVALPNDHSIQTLLYPNPSEDLLHVELREITEVASVEVLDMSGKLLNQFQIQAGNRVIKTIDVSNLPVGLYVLQVRTALGNEAHTFEVK